MRNACTTTRLSAALGAALSLTTALAPFAALADDEGPYRAPRRFELLGGASLGLSTLTSTDVTGTATGTQTNLMLIGSLYHDSWIFDLGVGYSRSLLNGTDRSSTPFTLETRTGLIEVSPRYVIAPRWQLGPVVSFHYGAPADYRPSSTATQAGLQALVGPKLVYEWPVSRAIDLRFIAKAQVDTDLAARRLFVIAGGIEIGFYRTPSSEPEPAPAPLPAAPEPPPSPAPEPALAPVADATAPVVKVDLPLSLVNFEFRSADLDAKSKEFLQRLSDVMKKHAALWGTLDVSGHTDTRGSDAFNQRLSERRASSVVKAFVGNGIDTKKFRSQGFGKSKPLDPGQSEEAHAKNRRVELTFKDVSDTAALAEALKGL